MKEDEKDDIKQEYRDAIYSIIHDNIAKDLKKLNPTSKVDQSNVESDHSKDDFDSTAGKDYFTDNLRRSITDEINSNQAKDELEMIIDKVADAVKMNEVDE